MTGPYFYLTEGLRIIRATRKAKKNPKIYEGKASEICHQIVEDCWNGKFFQTSMTSFPQFWARDFGWCTKSLMKLGYKDKVHRSLRYALNAYMKKGKITTTISPKGKAYDFPYYAVDSLPWLIHSIKISKFDYDNYLTLLNKEIQRFYKIVVDAKEGMVVRDQKFSSMKDFSVRDGSCYDNCMLAMLAMDLYDMNLYNPFKMHGLAGKSLDTKRATQEFFSRLIAKKFWNGHYFYDDLQKLDYIAGDANLFPFITGIVTREDRLKSVIKQISYSELDKPFPLKYTNSRKQVKFIAQEFLFRDYESDSIWTHMGPLYIKLVEQVDKDLAHSYKAKYTAVIEQNGGFVEVFFADGRIYESPVYYADRAMLWACNYLTL
ncbi:MAG: hypothetical protein KJ896_01830 [Nanoarchaeota archaeon]|nr:hypothetical protein [Nanoarchaeota archaeon]